MKFAHICYISSMQKTEVVILAAGYGKRMQSDLPKVLVPLHGKPLAEHVLEAVVASGVCESPVVVVGQKRELVMETLGSAYRYATQDEQLGTGHAVLSTAPMLEGKTENVLVMSGDVPYTKSASIHMLAEMGAESEAVLTMATVKVPDFNEWRAGFYDFGRIIRNASGDIVQIVEKKDATPEQLEITEVNSGSYSFKASWLWQHLRELKNENTQGEYYLTDLVGMACAEDADIASVAIDPREAIGVNTKEHLDLLHKL
jgi:bifunctional UDP-N-acetylglucosamine pyrophosphorylase/glucosamine-1-phosphate N-acetyltransferase